MVYCVGPGLEKATNPTSKMSVRDGLHEQLHSYMNSFIRYYHSTKVIAHAFHGMYGMCGIQAKIKIMIICFCMRVAP
jgi:hypothetical protein